MLDILNKIADNLLHYLTAHLNWIGTYVYYTFSEAPQVLISHDLCTVIIITSIFIHIFVYMSYTRLCDPGKFVVKYFKYDLAQDDS